MKTAKSSSGPEHSSLERQFHTVLLAVMALLQREQRVTYRTLRYVFGVDEACLHAVRDELRFRQLTRDEGGEGLVGTGADAPPAVSAPYPAPAAAMVLPAAPPYRPPPGGEIAGAARCHEPGTPVAAAG